MIMLHGLSAVDFALLLVRWFLGVFFVLARFRFFFDPVGGAKLPSVSTGNYTHIRYNTRLWCNPRRIHSLTNKLKYCGCSDATFWAWIAAIVEVAAGIGLIIGLLSWLSALGLLVVLLFATACTARDKVLEQSPVDRIDVVCAYLWRVEGLYICLALVILLAGPGAYSLDYLIWR